MFWQEGKSASIQERHTKRLKFMLMALDTAETISDLRLPGYHLHKLEPKKDGVWSIRVSGNYRLTFKFDKKSGNVLELDYVDYH